MEKMWAGNLHKAQDELADDFNSSIVFDARMYEADIRASAAHATMLAAKGIITEKDRDTLLSGLEAILYELTDGELQIDPAAEDIHTFVESQLISRVGDTAKKLHTARSRNDQVATDMRLYLRREAERVKAGLASMIDAILTVAKANTDTVMPGYTHLQRAQPILFSQQLLAYAMMFLRDNGRLCDAVKRMNKNPLGSCALAGTTYPIDRRMTAELLEFDGVTENSIDGVSDRDYCVELLSCFSLIMMHLSRFAEEIILWSSFEFRFVELDDAYTTGSSIMPQKKNPDIAELVRGKTGRVYGDLMAMLTVLKGLPLAYNKDMQEDKEAMFDALDTVKLCLDVFPRMVATMHVRADKMLAAAKEGFINATDYADYLTVKGIPFRTAYRISGDTVAYCTQNGKVLDDLSLEEFRKFCPEVDKDVYHAIDLYTCVENRVSEGGTGKASVMAQIAYVEGKRKSEF